jgi:hypothetical protein
METIAIRKTLRTLAVLMAVICATGAPAGCVYQRAEEASQAKTALIGMTREKIET